jgi:hypothetical protein
MLSHGIPLRPTANAHTRPHVLDAFDALVSEWPIGSMPGQWPHLRLAKRETGGGGSYTPNMALG